MQVGWQSRLLIFGDLHLQHHSAKQGRDSEIQMNFQSSYGMGRRFAKYSRGGWDNLKLVNTFLADFLIDVMFLVKRPSRINLRTVLIRIKGFFAGFRSGTSTKVRPQFSSKINSTGNNSGHISSIP
jgi:hypothetical protein